MTFSPQQIEQSPEQFHVLYGEHFIERFNAAYLRWCRRRGINPEEETFRAKAGRPKKKGNL